jgi:hypothetical protein
MMASHVRRGNDPILLHQLCKLLRSTLERQQDAVTRFQSDNRKHLFSDPEQEIIAPLDFFINVGKRKTKAANGFDIHGLVSKWSMVNGKASLLTSAK